VRGSRAKNGGRTGPESGTQKKTPTARRQTEATDGEEKRDSKEVVRLVALTFFSFQKIEEKRKSRRPTSPLLYRLSSLRHTVVLIDFACQKPRRFFFFFACIKKIFFFFLNL